MVKASDSDSDASPPRRPRHNRGGTISRGAPASSDSDASPPRRPKHQQRLYSKNGANEEDLRLKEEAKGKGDDSGGVRVARYGDDRELNDVLRKRTRWGDPMEGLLRKKDKVAKRKRRVYQGPPAPPNRFGIMPGPRWDGQDRSNGFETKLFRMRADREASKQKRQAMDMFGL